MGREGEKGGREELCSDPDGTAGALGTLWTTYRESEPRPGQVGLRQVTAAWALVPILDNLAVTPFLALRQAHFRKTGKKPVAEPPLPKGTPAPILQPL